MIIGSIYFKGCGREVRFLLGDASNKIGF